MYKLHKIRMSLILLNKKNCQYCETECMSGFCPGNCLDMSDVIETCMTEKGYLGCFRSMSPTPVKRHYSANYGEQTSLKYTTFHRQNKEWSEEDNLYFPLDTPEWHGYTPTPEYIFTCADCEHWHNEFCPLFHWDRNSQQAKDEGFDGNICNNFVDNNPF